MRYLRVGGTRQSRFAGTSLQPRKLPENAASPTRRVHAVLGAFANQQRVLHGFLSNEDSNCFQIADSFSRLVGKEK